MNIITLIHSDSNYIHKIHKYKTKMERWSLNKQHFLFYVFKNNYFRF